MSGSKSRQVPALIVNQWLPGWDKIDFEADEHRAKLERHFYLISLLAREIEADDSASFETMNGVAYGVFSRLNVLASHERVGLWGLCPA